MGCSWNLIGTSSSSRAYPASASAWRWVFCIKEGDYDDVAGRRMEVGGRRTGKWKRVLTLPAAGLISDISDAITSCGVHEVLFFSTPCSTILLIQAPRWGLSWWWGHTAENRELTYGLICILIIGKSLIVLKVTYFPFHTIFSSPTLLTIFKYISFYKVPILSLLEKNFLFAIMTNTSWYLKILNKL